MSRCDTCKNRGDCKESEAHRRFEELVAVGEDVNCTGYEYQKPLTQEEFNELFRNAPTADVIEVVRCKDCKFSRAIGSFRRCEHTNVATPIGLMEETHYCSYGERRQ